MKPTNAQALALGAFSTFAVQLAGCGRTLEAMDETAQLTPEASQGAPTTGGARTSAVSTATRPESAASFVPVVNNEPASQEPVSADSAEMAVGGMGGDRALGVAGSGGSWAAAGGNGGGSGGIGGGASASSGAGGMDQGGAGRMDQGGVIAPLECVECEQGYQCFEDVDPTRCFKVCETDAPDVVVETAEELAALAAMDCEVIGRNLELSGEAAENLSQLKNIRVIAGGLSIHDTENLHDFSGLEGVVLIEDGLDVRYNAGLVDISALSGAVGHGSLAMTDNPVLESLDGVQGFKNPDGLLFASNSGLTDLSALSPETVGSMLFAGNQAFGVLRFENMHTVDGDLGIVGETACEGIELPSLDYVGGGVLISGNPQLREINLSSLTRAESLNISTNESLTTIGGLPSLMTLVDSSAIANNTMLPQCEVDPIIERVPQCDYCMDNDATGTCGP